MHYIYSSAESSAELSGSLLICKMEIIIHALIILDRYQVVVLSALWGNRVPLIFHAPPHPPAK